MDSNQLHDMVDKIMRLSLETYMMGLDVSEETQESILKIIVEEASRLIEIFFSTEEIVNYAAASQLILTIPKEKMIALQQALAPKITQRLSEEKLLDTHD